MKPIKEQTLLLAINRGVLARNILRAGVLELLLKDENLRVVIVINTKIQDYFKKEFSHPRIILEEVKSKKNSNLRRYWYILTQGLVYTESQNRVYKYGGRAKNPLPFPVYFLVHGFFLVASRLRFLKKLVRFIENRLLIERDYDYLFKKYKPDLVFCASIYSHGLDFILIKAARRLGIPSVSMAKSWDTIGRLFFSAPSDFFILTNEIMKLRVIHEQLIAPGRIFISGLPQFDIYAQARPEEREIFLERIGLNPKKPKVEYALEGDWTDWVYIYNQDNINNHELLSLYNVILRPHPSDAQKGRYNEFNGVKGIYVDDQHISLTNMFGDKWDPTMSDMRSIGSFIGKSDVVVTFPSTFTLDAFALGKPVVNVYYDIPGKVSSTPTVKLYDSVHYNAVLAEKSVTLARSSREIMEGIKNYLKNPGLLQEERSNTLRKIAYKIDGLSSERIARVLLGMLRLL